MAKRKAQTRPPRKPAVKTNTVKKKKDEGTDQELMGQAWEDGKAVKCAPDESEVPEEVDENEEEDD